MEKQIKRKTELRYSVILTCGEYKENEESNYQFNYDNYDDAVERFSIEVLNAANHCIFVETSRIMGLYNGDKCLKQVVINGYSIYYDKNAKQ